MVNAAEHRVQMQAAPPSGKVVPAAPEKRLNRFVHSIASMERVGNALGTLDFTWATVVVLSGYPTVLHVLDFWFATAIIFLEGLRYVCNFMSPIHFFLKKKKELPPASLYQSMHASILHPYY